MIKQLLRNKLSEIWAARYVFSILATIAGLTSIPIIIFLPLRTATLILSLVGFIWGLAVGIPAIAANIVSIKSGSDVKNPEWQGVAIITMLIGTTNFVFFVLSF